MVHTGQHKTSTQDYTNGSKINPSRKPGTATCIIAEESKQETKRVLDREIGERICRSYGLFYEDRLINDILDEYITKKGYENHYAHSCLEMAKPSFDGIRYSELTESRYLSCRDRWDRIDPNFTHTRKIRRRKQWRKGPLTSNSIRSIERIFRAAISLYDSNCIFKRRRILLHRDIPRDALMDEILLDNSIVTNERGLRNVSLSAFEVQTIISNAKTAISQLVFKLLVKTGARFGDLRRTKWSNVDFIRKRIKIAGVYEIPIDNAIFDDLLKLKRFRRIRTARIILKHRKDLSALERRKLYNDTLMYIFPENVILPKTTFYERIRSEFKSICKTNNFRDYHLHDLRHTAATEWYKRCDNLYKVSLALGHSTIKMTQDYIDSTAVDVFAKLLLPKLDYHSDQLPNGQKDEETIIVNQENQSRPPENKAA